MGVIISFIDSEFNLLYKLIGFEDFQTHRTAINTLKRKYRDQLNEKNLIINFKIFESD